MISHKLLGESFTITKNKHYTAVKPYNELFLAVFCIQRLLIAGRHRLWLRLRRYLIVFDPLTFVLD